MLPCPTFAHCTPLSPARARRRHIMAAPRGGRAYVRARANRQRRGPRETTPRRGRISLGTPCRAVGFCTFNRVCGGGVSIHPDASRGICRRFSAPALTPRYRVRRASPDPRSRHNSVWVRTYCTGRMDSLPLYTKVRRARLPEAAATGSSSVIEARPSTLVTVVVIVLGFAVVGTILSVGLGHAGTAFKLNASTP